jgi:phospholipid-transporting ATPase
MASNGVVLEDAVDALGEDMSATDEDSDTRRLLGEQAASYNYGSSTSDGRERSRKTNKTHSSPWSQPFSHLLSLAQSWKRRKMIPRNRRIDINSGLPPSASFCSNRVSTTKYNPLTFFPYFLFDQFRRYANLFFLAIGLLQQIPGISPTGKFTTLFPLGLVLLATAAKEIIEDVKRFRADNQVNRRKVYVLRADKWHRVRWTQVKVGDIVRVENKQFFPADLLFLSSSDPLGLCYVETSNLDGETNLKIRQAHPDTLKVSQVETLQGYLECEGPNNRLYEFNGNLSIAAKRPVPIQPDNVLLRGSLLRNTQWVHGLVVYTGPDSKLQQNGTETRLKRSAMDNATNRQVIFMFLVLLVLAVVSSLGYSIWTSLWADKMWYLYMANESASKMAANFFYSILTFIILYNNLIPISLIITVEVVKLIQAYLINFDLDMYDESTDTPALARNSNLNEELGQVKFVFSDKTGTLTENIMEFKQCSVSGIVYSTDSSEEGDDSSPLVLREALKGSGRKAMLHFFRVLALCHTVIPEWVEDSQSLVYRASSPDEEALVKAARDLGVVFKARTPKSIIIEVDGAEEEYELLNLLEFNSTRKRMSVVVRFPDGSIRVLCKGADTVIYSRLAPSEDYSSSTNSHLKTFAVTGLRTLCVAERTIGLVDYEEWEKVYYAASTHLVKEEKEKKLDEAAELIEQV